MTSRRQYLWVVVLLVALTAVTWSHHLTAEGPSPQRSPAATVQQRLQSGEIDAQRSRVYVHVGKTGLGHDHGVEGRISSGVVHLGSAQNAGQIVFDMTSFDADTPAARRFVGLSGTTDASSRRSVTANMLGSSVLDSSNYPTATFQIASALPLVDAKRRLRGYRLDGEFTLHGVTKPLQVDATAAFVEGGTHLQCKFSILQTQFGITPFSKAFGVVGVADRLTIYGDAWLAASLEPQP